MRNVKSAARALLALGLALGLAGGAQAAERTCRSTGGDILALARAFTQTLTPAQTTAAVRPYAKADAIKWSNLPLALAPRVGVRLGDLSGPQAKAADGLLRAALSSCGYELLNDIRAADAVLKPLDARKIGWDAANYFVAFVGEPSADRPWLLKVDGHHLAYNITFNGAHVSATPLFDGVEPLTFQVDGKTRDPLAVQAGAMRKLAAAVAGMPGARLAGEFRDVSRGPVQGGDVNFPISYPTGPEGRGVAYASLNPAQKAAVSQAIRAWVELPTGAISRRLMADYTKPAALAETFVGLSGASDLASPGAYIRIDGPRLWIEFVVQPAVADAKAVHYHTIWRDKLADYGGAFRN